jgi:hypothetical protein
VIGALSVSTQLAIGNSAGTANFSGDLTLGAGSVYLYELTGGVAPDLGSGDLGNISGSLTIVPGAVLDLVALGTYTAGNKFTLFGYTGTLAGTFNDATNTALADGDTFTDAGGVWMIDYNDLSSGANGGTGTSFITITAVPEPGTLALGSLAVLSILRRRRNH